MSETGIRSSFSIPEANLSAASCDSVLAALNFFVDGRTGGSILLDLSDIEFVDPYGMGLLSLIGRFLSSRFSDVACRFPADPGTESYLTRMRLFEALRDYVTLERVPRTERRPLHNEGLLEVSDIEDRADIESVLAAIEARVSSILTAELGYTFREITDFKNVVAELCHNILDHSGDQGVLVAQRYLNQKLGKKFAIIGVCDLGMGIRESLSGRFDVSEWNHADAVSKAIRREFSRETARGLGLYIVNQICQTYQGSLHIRSGDARVYFRGRRTYVHPGKYFPGTQVSITLYEKG